MTKGRVIRSCSARPRRRPGWRGRLAGWLLGCFLLVPLAPLCAVAQDDAADERAATFEAAPEGAQTEDVPGGMLMVAAYGVIWVLVLGYVASLGIRQARTVRDLERLRQDLASHVPEDEA